MMPLPGRDRRRVVDRHRPRPGDRRARRARRPAGTPATRRVLLPRRPARGRGRGVRAAVRAVRPAVRGPVAARPPGPTSPPRCSAGRDDRFFPPDFQRRLAAERLGCAVDEIPGGHLVALSRPVELADYLARGRPPRRRGRSGRTARRRRRRRGSSPAPAAPPGRPPCPGTGRRRRRPSRPPTARAVPARAGAPAPAARPACSATARTTSRIATPADQREQDACGHRPTVAAHTATERDQFVFSTTRSGQRRRAGRGAGLRAGLHRRLDDVRARTAARLEALATKAHNPQSVGEREASVQLHSRAAGRARRRRERPLLRPAGPPRRRRRRGTSAGSGCPPTTASRSRC